MSEQTNPNSDEKETLERKDAAYWLSRPPAERFAELERLRQEEYGYDASTAKMEKVITIVDWPGN